MVQRGVVRPFRRARTHRLFAKGSLVVVGESSTGSVELVMSELVRYDCVESMAEFIKKKGIEV